MEVEQGAKPSPLGPEKRSAPAAFSARQSMGPGHEQHPPISDQSVAAQLEDQGSELEAAYWREAKLFRRFPQGRLKLPKEHLIPLHA